MFNISVSEVRTCISGLRKYLFYVLNRIDFMQKKNSIEKFKKIALNPIKFKLLMLVKLPAAFFSGAGIRSLDESSCTTFISFKWQNQNPFKSIYFACLAMTAELSTGAIALMYTYDKKPTISMLVLNMTAEFSKKAVGKIHFICQDGRAIKEAIDRAAETKEGQTIKVQSVGFDESKQKVATFYFTWTFKSK